jgi:hypothetical protein
MAARLCSQDAHDPPQQSVDNGRCPIDTKVRGIASSTTHHPANQLGSHFKNNNNHLVILAG